MSEQRYDNYRIALTPRPDGTYDVLATDAAGSTVTGTFTLPFDDGALTASIVQLARTAIRGTATREVGPTDAPAHDAEHLGRALNDALFAGEIGPNYDAARARAAEHQRGLRLTLALGAAPALLSVPWELLYRPPRFLANQRRTPLVRQLDVPRFPQPPAIDGAVHVLGIVASPTDLTRLDVEAEKSRVAAAIRPVVEAGRVDLDWLEPATPRRLREALRDGNYHVVHYVGHGDFTADGDGVLFLETDAGTQAVIDSTELANLLADQASLRLVVLNSCEGARTSFTDPFAGVATTLIQLGVPAVVAMQFAISDAAAILFAEELYTNLIARQTPIDAAVSEARKAIFIEQQTMEWATPVLFLGNTDIDLFEFRVAVAEVSPRARRPGDPDVPIRNVFPAPSMAPPPGPVDVGGGSTRRRLGVLVGAAVAIVAVGAFAIYAMAGRADDGDDPDVSTTAVTGPATTLAPAPGAAPGDDTEPAGTDAATDEQSPSGDEQATADEPGQAQPATLGPDERYTGGLSGPDDSRTHPFEATAGSIVNLSSAIDTCTSLTYTLNRPSGQIADYDLGCSDLGRVELVESGTYTVVVEANGAPGLYDLTLTRVPADAVEAVGPDGAITGALGTLGERQVYTFDAGSGDTIGVVTSNDSCNGLIYTVLSPSGRLLDDDLTCSDSGRIELGEPGGGSVQLDSNGSLGTFDLELVRVPPDVVEEVTGDATMTGELDTRWARHVYEFTASAGEVVELTSDGSACPSMYYTLLDRDGVTLDYELVCYDMGEVTLPSTGPYSIVVEATRGTGLYDVTIRRDP